MGSLDSAMANGRAWYETIKEQIAALRHADNKGDSAASEAARDAIEEGPLSILVRDGWRMPDRASVGAEEYEILLSTGGPALRIWGKLDGYCQPESATLQAQDWGTPWTRVEDCSEDTLLAYASVFYFGEG